MDELISKIRTYVGHRGAVYESEVLKEFLAGESSEETLKVKRAVALLINNGEMLCKPTQESVYLLSLSDRCLH